MPLPGTVDFALLVLFLTFGATLWGGFVAGPRRLVPFLVFLGPLFLPAYATFPIPGLPDIERVTAVTIPAALLLLFSPRECWQRFRAGVPDLLMLVFVTWSVICVGVNQGPWAATSMTARQFLVFVMPWMVGRLYVQEERDLVVLVKAVIPMLVIYLGLMLFEARFYPQFQGMVYGEHVLGLNRGGLFRPIVFTQGALELGHMMCMLAMIMVGLWRTQGPVRRRVSTLDVGVVFSILCTLACLSRGPITALLMGLFIPLLVRRPALVSCLIGTAGVLFYFWMLGPSGQALLVGAALTDEGDTDPGMSLFFRFLQIEHFKPMVEASPIFGYGESWERTGVIKIIDGVLLLVTLGFGYPGAVLLSVFWLSCIWIIGRRAPRPDNVFEMIGVHIAPVLGFLVFSAWGDSFLRAPHYVLMGSLVGILGKYGAKVESPDPNPIRRLVLRTG